MNRTDENRKWYVYARKADFNGLAARYGITPVTARIMINRGVQPEDFYEFLHGGSALHDPHKMMDMDLAADIIGGAVAGGDRIRIVGDYDIDGVCATTILTGAIARLGGHVDYDIPERIRDGYGINDRIIDSAIADGVDLIVTCDNGISAATVIGSAVEHGISVVITDHHQVPDELPDADAIVDPGQKGDPYPFREICGAMVAYKLVQVLYENAGLPASELDDFTEFAAMATIGDVMPLRDENRTIVRRGIELLKKSKNVGVNALIDACGIQRERLGAYTIGFVLGPCINAGGRLRSPEIAMQLFAARDAETAGRLAAQLKALNDERKSLTEQYVDAAKQQTDSRGLPEDVLVLYLPDCHESVAGIIAGRIREYYHRPAIVLTNTENDEEMVKGSARSIEAYDIYEKLTEASEFLEKFGGHRQAAGMSLRRSRIDAFRRFLNEHSGLAPTDFIEKIWIDTALPFAYATVEQTEELELLEPFGQGNERPVFAQKNVEVLSAKSLPGHRNFVKLRLKDEFGTVCDGIIFADADETLNALAKRERIDILYYPKPDVYGGRKTVQIQIKAWK